MRDLTRDLGVGTCCGKCVPEAKATLSASLGQRQDSAAGAFFPGGSPEFAV